MWILVPAYNAACFTVSQTLPNFKDTVTDNAHLVVIDHLIMKQYSTQRYQKVSAN